MKSITVARAKSPGNDKEIQNRISCFNDAVKGTQAAQVQVPTKPSTPHVLHFAVTVGPPGAPMYLGPNVAVGPYVKLASTGGQAQANTSKVVLTNEHEIQILALWIEGALSDEGVIFVSPA